MWNPLKYVVEAVEISSVFEVRDEFILSHTVLIFKMQLHLTMTKYHSFLRQLPWVRNRLIWFLKKPKAKETEFWKTQRTRRITASNVYKICHFRDSTIKDNALKGRFNNCPSGVMCKETTAIKHDIKKIQRKHKGFCVENSGLVTNVLWPHLGASPDGIRYCDCCERGVVEVKSLFAKRNHGQYTLKKETR